MIFHVMTLFPDMIRDGMNTSILGRAIESGRIGLDVVNIRDYTLDKHKKVDDYPYGGGAGMLMFAQPVYDCCMDIMKNIKCAKAPRVIYLSPKGRTFDQKMAAELAGEEELIFLCGHYEGIDQRVIDRIVTDEVSIGDYVLTGGELPCMVMMDTISRLVPGVLNNDESALTESFGEDLLEYPQYTRPEVWMGQRVPEILLSGDHARVDAWRLEQAEKITMERRPELYASYREKHPVVVKKKRRRKHTQEETAGEKPADGEDSKNTDSQ